MFQTSYFDKSINTIGSGISGNAKLYRSNKLNVLYVMKTYHNKESYETKEEYVERVLVEYHILRSLDHINVIKALGYLTSYTVKIYLQAGSPNLSTLIKTCQPSPSELLCIWKQICIGILYIHNKGICHRDLKLHNIVFDTDFHNIKIIDWCTASSNVECLGIVGLEPLAAPEQFSHIRYQGLPVDIWSLGILLIQLCSGKYPWNCAIDSNKRFGNYKENRKLGLPVGIEGLALEMLELNPEKRLAIGGVLENQWFNLVNYCGETKRCGFDHKKTFGGVDYER